MEIQVQRSRIECRQIIFNNSVLGATTERIGPGSSCCPYCWMSPRGFMSVCRAMYREAIATVYRCNRIVVMPWREDCRLLDPAPPGSTCQRVRLDASRFIGANVDCYPAALSHLRHLEIVFPDLELKGPPSQHEIRAWDSLCRDWSVAVRCLRQVRGEGHLAELTITVHMGIVKVARIRYAFLTDRRRLKWFVEGKLASARKLVADSTNGICTDTDLVRRHAALLNPLRQLRDVGLARLHVFLDSNWYRVPSRNVHDHRAVVDDTIVPMEQMLEQGVMGKAYHSKAEGRTKQSPSKWMVAKRPVIWA